MPAKKWPFCPGGDELKNQDSEVFLTDKKYCRIFPRVTKRAAIMLQIEIYNLKFLATIFQYWRAWERERERLSLSAFLGTKDIGVHIVHISRVTITYTLE